MPHPIDLQQIPFWVQPGKCSMTFGDLRQGDLLFFGRIAEPNWIELIVQLRLIGSTEPGPFQRVNLVLLRWGERQFPNGRIVSWGHYRPDVSMRSRYVVRDGKLLAVPDYHPDPDGEQDQ